MPYFSSHNHSDMSNFRLLDAINRPSDLFDRAIELGLTGFAITDHEALSAHKQIMDIRDSKIKEGSLPADFTVAFGNEAYLVDELVSGQDYYHWLLIAKDKKGHSILRKLSSQAWDNMYTDRGMARVPLTKAQVESIMEEHDGKGHIIATSACLGGEIGKNLLSIKGVIDSGGKPTEDLLQRVNDNISNYIAWNKKVFGEDDFYLEIAPNTKGDQRFVNQRMKNISKSTGTRMIFATDSHYLRKEDQPIHRAFLNSSDGEREVDEFYSTAYMMDFEEVHDMLSLDFSEEEIKEMVENLEHVRSKVSHYDLNHEQVIPKVEVDPHGIEYRIPTDKDREYISKMLESDEEQNLYWVRKCLSELDKRDKWSEKYLDALEDEARVLYRISERLHQPMSSYYNTAEKLVDLMWNEGNSLVGPGRGSATAFLSNWLLDITQVDPLEYELPYWRHLSEERPELPKTLGIKCEPC